MIENTYPEFEIEENVLKSFNGFKARNLKTITVPDGVEVIGQKVFVCCNCIERIILPDSV